MSNEGEDNSAIADAAKQPESPKPEQQYTALVSIRNTELAAYWARYNIQSVINFGLLAAALASRSDSYVGQHMSSAAVAGIVLAIIWTFFVVKGKELLTERWERHIRSYEENSTELRYKLFCKIKKEEDGKSREQRGWDNFDVLARGLPLLCLVAWLVILTTSLACN